MIIGALLFVLFLILAIIKIAIHYKSKKEMTTILDQLEARKRLETKKEKPIAKKVTHGYQYWDKIIDGSETVVVDASEITSQVLLDNWDFVANYYYVIKENLNDLRNDPSFSEEEIIHNLTYNSQLTEALYKRELAKIKDRMIDFLTNSIENHHKLRKPAASVPLKVISFIYSLEDNTSFYLIAEPSREFYTNKYANYVREFEWRYEFEIDISAIEHAIYKELNITIGEYSDDTGMYTYELFRKLMIECWSIAKKNASTTLLGTLLYGTGGIDYDLETGESIDWVNLEEHYKKKGIIIEKDSED